MDKYGVYGRIADECAEKNLESKCFRSLNDLNLNPSLHKFNITVPNYLDDRTLEQMVRMLNKIPNEKVEALYKKYILDKQININGAYAKKGFIDTAKEYVRNHNVNPSTYVFAEGQASMITEQYFNSVKEFATKVKNLHTIFSTPVNDVPEIIERAEKHPGLKKLLEKELFKGKSLYEISAYSNGTKEATTNFRRLVTPLSTEIKEVTDIINRSAAGTLSGMVKKVGLKFNLTLEEVPIKRLLKEGVVLTDVFEVKSFISLAGSGGTLFKAGFLGLDIYNAFSSSNPLSLKGDDARRTAFKDTGTLVGCYIMSNMTNATLDMIAVEIVGETALMCCGPVGWGILLVGAVIAAEAGQAGGGLVGESSKWCYDNLIEPCLPSIKRWISEYEKYDFPILAHGIRAN